MAWWSDPYYKGGFLPSIPGGIPKSAIDCTRTSGEALEGLELHPFDPQRVYDTLPPLLKTPIASKLTPCTAQTWNAKTPKRNATDATTSLAFIKNPN